MHILRCIKSALKPPTPARDIQPQHDMLNRPDFSRYSVCHTWCLAHDKRIHVIHNRKRRMFRRWRLRFPNRNPSNANAGRLTACHSVKPSLEAALRQWIFASLKRFMTVREVPGKLAATLIWFAEWNGFSSWTLRTASSSSLVDQRGLPVE